jgi:hypothetical protein
MTTPSVSLAPRRTPRPAFRLAVFRFSLLVIVLLVLALLALAVSGPASSSSSSSRLTTQGAINSDLVAHEWGTFTSVAGRSGEAVEWRPSSSYEEELPRFVEFNRSADSKVRLRGTVRMETPVLYFYSPHQTHVSVQVGFSRGVITEWYPHASHVESSEKVLEETALYDHPRNGGISWDSVSVEPGLSPSFPLDRSHSIYYAARETAATPLVVGTPKGEQQEKFLFYRGVAAFSVPVSAAFTPDKGLVVKNLGDDEIPSVIWFERHGDQFGYRLGGSLQGEAQMDAPEVSSSSSIDSLCSELEGILTAQGLNADEAHAMVETWRHSWFEEGSRLLYIVPRHFVDSVLPLSIRPAPAQVTRVFVGRVELISPATEKTVLAALEAHDRRTIIKYTRFLDPILDQLKAEHPEQAKKLESDLEATYQVPVSMPESR